MTKRLLYILSCLLIIVLLISSFSSFVSAENEDEEKEEITAEQLEPACDEVVFLRDVTEEEAEYLDGWGFDVDNPFVARDHYNYDPNEDTPKNYLQTAFYQATEWFEVSGGTVVICGPVYLGSEQAYGLSEDDKDVLTAEFGENTIKFTSVYDGVDYRKTNNAKIILDGSANLSILGQSIWENIDIETRTQDRVISFNGYNTLIGNGVNCYPRDKSAKEIATNYVSIVGGNRVLGMDNEVTDLYVKSGSYNVISAGMWGIDSKNNMTDCITNLTLDGTVTVYGEVTGTTVQEALFSGHSNITIKSGYYLCDINMVGRSGHSGENGNAVLKISGGDFSKCWSINDCAVGGLANKACVYTLIDFSGWSGEIGDIYKAFRLITSVSDIKYPDNLTQNDIIEFVEETESEKNETAKLPETDNSETEKEPVSSGKNSTDTVIIISVISVAVIAVVAAVIVVYTVNKRE